MGGVDMHMHACAKGKAIRVLVCDETREYIDRCERNVSIPSSIFIRFVPFHGEMILMFQFHPTDAELFLIGINGSFISVRCLCNVFAYKFMYLCCVMYNCLVIVLFQIKQLWRAKVEACFISIYKQFKFSLDEVKREQRIYSIFSFCLMLDKLQLLV